MTVQLATEQGTRSDVLRALQWRLAVALQDPATSSAAVVSLTRVMIDVTLELRRLEGGR